jgi:hypothetical protein
LPRADAGGAFLTDGKAWSLVRTRGPVLAAVFEASSKETAERLAEAVLRQPQ